METSSYIAVAALLLSMALTWKSLFNGKNGTYAKETDMDKLIDRVAEMENEIAMLKDLRSEFEKLSVELKYEVKTRLTLVEREIFRQELVDEMEKKRLIKKEPI